MTSKAFGLAQLGNGVNDGPLQVNGTVTATDFVGDGSGLTGVGGVTSVTAGDGLAGGTITTSGTISHADTSSQASVNNSGATVIQDVTLDTYGHVTGLGSTTLTAADVGAPSTTGSGASGTWGINVTGSANTATGLTTGRTNWNNGVVINNVVGQLAWKNYGNNHTIFDASQSTSPSGTGVNSTNAQVGWAPSYPTLMGWNGVNTYGVRVDSARIADSVASAPAPSTAQVGSATAGLGAGSVGSYAFARSNTDTTSRTAGATVTGSQYGYAGGYTTTDSILLIGTGSGTLSGTWRVMGYFNSATSSSRRGFSLLLRIS